MLDHMPLYRQMERFSRSGINIPSSTMSDWVSATCNLITPLYEALKKEVLNTHYLHVNETTIKVQDRDKKGTTHRGYYWVYHNSIIKLVFFDYREGRGREGHAEMLTNFNGYLQIDGYVAYDIFETKTEVTLLGCMAHARGMFIDALDNDAATAEYVLDQMQQLYLIEKQIKEYSFEERKSLRTLKAVPILEHLGQWMKQQYILMPIKKNNIGRALAYSIERWDRLSRYCRDGMLNIDNNPVENSIRPVALGRKNYLFAGSHEAAKRSGMLYSLFGTCKLTGIDPYAWLKEILTIIPSHLLTGSTNCFLTTENKNELHKC